MLWRCRPSVRMIPLLVFDYLPHLSPFCHPWHPLKRVQALCGRRFCHPVTLFHEKSYHRVSDSPSANYVSTLRSTLEDFAKGRSYLHTLHNLEAWAQELGGRSYKLQVTNYKNVLYCPCFFVPLHRQTQRIAETWKSTSRISVR